jgi:hypothetical protein
VLTEHINIFKYEDTSQLATSPKRLGFVECSNFRTALFHISTNPSA